MQMLRFIEPYKKDCPEGIKAILNERIHLLFATSAKQLIFGYSLAIVLAAGFLKVLPVSVVLKWLLPLTVVYIARYYLVASYKKQQVLRSYSNTNHLKTLPRSFYFPKIWLYRYRLSAFVGGLSWGMAGWWLFMPDSYIYLNLLFYALSGMTVAILLAMALDLISAILFMVVMWSPLLINFFISNQAYSSTATQMLILFLIFAVFFINHSAKKLIENIYIKHNADKREALMQKLITHNQLQFERSPLAMIEWNLDFTVNLWNPAAESMFGYNAQEISGCKGEILVVESARKQVNKIWSSLITESKITRQPFQVSMKIHNDFGNTSINQNVRKDGELIICEWNNTLLTDETGQVYGVSSIVEDITDRELYKTSIEEQRHLALSLVNSSTQAIFVLNPQHEVIVWNDACAALTQLPASEVLGTRNHWRGFYHAPRPCLSDFLFDSTLDITKYYASVKTSELITGGLSSEAWLSNLKGHRFYLQFEAAPVFDVQGKLIAVVETLHDLTRFKLAEHEIHDLAYFDPLTNLPNRRQLIEKIQRLQAESEQNHQHLAFIFVDLDNFKLVNDSLGHSTGDQLLVTCSQRLLNCVRAEDTVVRLGGDEFVLVIGGLSTHFEKAVQQAEIIAKKVLVALEAPYHIQAMQHSVTGSLGLYLTQGQEMDADEIMKNADTALYLAKDSGKNTYRFYDAKMQAKANKKIQLINDLRLDTACSQLILFYQAQVRDHKVIGAEALIRWEHPNLGMLLPIHFMPLAEATELIYSIGRWILQSACNQLQAWSLEPSKKHLSLAVNISSKQFRLKHFVEEVIDTVKTTKINPTLLELEITETLLMDDMADAIQKIQRLKQHGIRFAMDDFGTGYSSLAYLRELPLDQIKIDKSFIDNITVNKSDVNIVQTIIAMANNLNMSVIAEGVETLAQQDQLKQLGCNTFQGFLYSKPCDIVGFQRFCNEMNLETHHEEFKQKEASLKHYLPN